MQWRAQTVIFDLDGVLIDSGKDIANADNFTPQTLGFPTLPSEQSSNTSDPALRVFGANVSGRTPNSF
jgi:phosphoglycolate phosphatase-like HAD superfamily hydrolase